ncbi:hypothetical protein [Dyella sp. 20L07]|uniref:hypothetical protein n=1 Tax=Dyella sp. 20L07 TaxID=3384240 RepID=UPI003D26893C
MTSRRLHTPFAALLAYLFSLLLLVGAPVRPLPLSADAASGKATVASVTMSDDVQNGTDAGKSDTSGKSTFEDNGSNSGMDDIIHPLETVRLWAPLPSLPPAASPYDVGKHDPARLLRPPEVA